MFRQLWGYLFDQLIHSCIFELRLVSILFQFYNRLHINFVVVDNVFREPRVDQTFLERYPLIIFILDHSSQKILGVFRYLLRHFECPNSYQLGDIIVSEPIKRVLASKHLEYNDAHRPHVGLFIIFTVQHLRCHVILCTNGVHPLITPLRLLNC